MESIKQSPTQNGFTLIELIVVIILISIMAVTVLPKFLTSSGFEEYTYRDELIIKLRAIQLRTMQQTNGGECRDIQVTPTIIRLLKTGTSPGSCIDYDDDDIKGDSTKVEIVDDIIRFSISDDVTSFSFTSLGKSLCAGVPCEITITVEGESSPQMFINSEGYIYAL